MIRLHDYPEEGDLVVCSVRLVKNFGAFVTLDEYGDKEGFIHIAEVTTGWVKYIRDYVREGQKIVCKVTLVSQPDCSTKNSVTNRLKIDRSKIRRSS